MRSVQGANAAIIDYLNFSFPFSAKAGAVLEFRGRLAKYIGHGLGGPTDRRRGLHGYRQSFAFDQGKALFAFGGQSGTAYVSLPGEACHLIPDWDGMIALLCDLCGRITRWDGAVDEYFGAHSVDDAVAWYLAGEFNAGGNKPACSQAGNWIDPDGKGRTFYVGSRKNGKLMDS